MHAKRVLLHGGPYHGKVVDVPEQNDHFHIMGMIPKGTAFGVEGHVETREGTYSQVSGPNNRNDFEWDGWVSH